MGLIGDVGQEAPKAPWSENYGQIEIGFFNAIFQISSYSTIFCVNTYNSFPSFARSIELYQENSPPGLIACQYKRFSSIYGKAYCSNNFLLNNIL